MTNTERSARGIWTVAAIVAGLAMVQYAGGDSTGDAFRALLFGFLLLLSLAMVHDVTRRH